MKIEFTEDDIKYFNSYFDLPPTEKLTALNLRAIVRTLRPRDPFLLRLAERCLNRLED